MNEAFNKIKAGMEDALALARGDVTRGVLHNGFWVKGGVYTSTDFTTLEEGSEEVYGPFPTYAMARDVWLSGSMAKVDTCCHRLTIQQISEPSSS